MTDQTEKTEKTDEKPVEDTIPSIDDALSAAWDAAEKDETPPDADEKPAEEAPAAASEPKETEAETAPVEAAPAEETESPDMPTWWGEDGMAVWSALSPEQQKVVAARESEHQNAIKQDQLPEGTRAALDRVEAIARPWGMSSDKAIESLVNAHLALTQRGPQAIKQLAAQYGVDLASLAGDPAETQQADPSQQLLQAVEQRVEQALGAFQAQQSEAQIRQQEQEIAEWAKETDANGAPLRPHFDKVEHLLPQEVAKVRTENPNLTPWAALDQAYKRVERVAAPQTVSIEDQIEKRVQERLAARAAEAEKAQKAAISPAAGASSQDGGYQSKGSIDDDLKNAWSKLSGEGAGRIM